MKPFNKNTYDSKSKIGTSSIFKRLETFIKIAENKSFSKAAAKLNLTPSGTSRSLSALEAQLGVTLFKRTTRNIILTEAGKYLLEQANRLLFDLDNIFDELAHFNQHPQGQLRVTCSFAFGTSHLIDLFYEYKEEYKDVSLLIDLNDHLVNLNEENFDIALRITYQPPEKYATRKITRIRWAYCASPKYLEENGEPQSLQDLELHSCLIYPHVSDAWKYKNENGQIIDLNINPTIQANSSSALLAAALHHKGIVYLPTYVLGAYIQSGHLKPLLIDESINEHEYSLYALYFPSRYRDPKVRSFIDFILNKISPNPSWDQWIKKEIIR